MSSEFQFDLRWNTFCLGCQDDSAYKGIQRYASYFTSLETISNLFGILFGIEFHLENRRCDKVCVVRSCMKMDGQLKHGCQSGVPLVPYSDVHLLVIRSGLKFRDTIPPKLSQIPCRRLRVAECSNRMESLFTYSAKGFVQEGMILVGPLHFSPADDVIMSHLLHPC